jgi:hypothetical protein
MTKKGNADGGYAILRINDKSHRFIRRIDNFTRSLARNVSWISHGTMDFVFSAIGSLACISSVGCLARVDELFSIACFFSDELGMFFRT